MARLRVGTRASALARWQTQFVIERLVALDPAFRCEVVELTTQGDDLPDAPLEQMEGIGFFTSTLERALLDRRIDIAVHSYKDLPVGSTPGLIVAATPVRGPAEDVLCARDGATLTSLPAGARVGSSSLRRLAQLRRLRADLEFLPLRGNVPTRIARVECGELDAVVLARAGLERLGLMTAATEIFPLERLLPAPAQGALAVQARREASDLVARLAGLTHRPTREAVGAERAVLRALRGGCAVPVGAYAWVVAGRLHLVAGVFDPDGGEAIVVTVEGDGATRTGEEAAQRLLSRGAGRILARVARAPRVAEIDG